MPSPMGHALAGLAAGWAIAPSPGSRQEALTRGAVFAVAATVPDLDLLFGVHRGPTHSLAAAVVAGAATWLWCGLVRARSGERGIQRRARSLAHHRRALRLALAVAAAYATHTVLDWLSVDTTAPSGIMALWPATHDYYASQHHVFLAISRRYWQPDFWALNLRALVRELAILGPVTAVVVWLRTPHAESRRLRTDHGNRERRTGS
jgi:inner membrane protein